MCRAFFLNTQDLKKQHKTNSEGKAPTTKVKKETKKPTTPARSR